MGRRKGKVRPSGYIYKEGVVFDKVTSFCNIEGYNLIELREEDKEKQLSFSCKIHGINDKYVTVGNFTSRKTGCKACTLERQREVLIKGYMSETFITSRGGVLTIKYFYFIKGERTRVKVSCSICNSDKELYPDLFDITITGMTSKKDPCGCNKFYVKSERQNILLLERYLKNTTRFIKEIEEYTDEETKVTVECTDCSRKLRGTFDRIRREDPECKGCLPSKHNAQDIINALPKHIFHKDTLFCKDTCTERKNQSVVWKVMCPQCKEDIFTIKYGLPFVFETVGHRLLIGQKPCRCNKFHEGGKEYVEAKAREALIKYQPNCIFIKITSLGDKHSVSYNCDKHDEVISPLSSLLGGKKCRFCQYRGFGYYPERADEEDTLYLRRFTSKGCEGLKESFIKIGRTFEMKDREDCFNKVYDTELLAFNVGRHEDIYNKEQEMHWDGREYHYTPNIPFGGSVNECFRIELLDKIIISED